MFFEPSTYYIIQPFYMIDDKITEGNAFEVPCESSGRKYVSRLNEQFVGFVLFSRKRCSWSGHYMDAEILGEYGVGLISP